MNILTRSRVSLLRQDLIALYVRRGLVECSFGTLPIAASLDLVLASIVFPDPFHNSQSSTTPVCMWIRSIKIGEMTSRRVLHRLSLSDAMRN